MASPRSSKGHLEFFKWNNSFFHILIADIEMFQKLITNFFSREFSELWEFERYSIASINIIRCASRGKLLVGLRIVCVRSEEVLCL